MNDIRPLGVHTPTPESNLQHDQELDIMRDSTPWNTVGGRVISLVSRKGGVGKTTSAVNLGAALALSGHTVLIVGTDSHCGVCRTLGSEPVELPVSLIDLFDHDSPLNELAQPAPVDGLWFVSPRVLTLAEEEHFHTAMDDRAGDFVRAIDRARNLYDTILIDCPPNLGPATRAALLASDSYLVPVQAEELCRGSVDDLLEFVDAFRARNFPDSDLDQQHPAAHTLGTPLALEGLFLTMASERTRMGRHVAARVGEDFGDLMFSSGIPRTTRLSEMALRGKPAVIYDRRSPGSRAYFDLADELVRRYCLGHGEDVSDLTISERFADDSPASESPDRDALSAAPAQTADATDGPKLNRFERFLQDLGGGEDPTPPVRYEEPSEPDMVSLDDLLAEEEQGQSRSDDRDWDEGHWSLDSDGPDRVN